METVSYLTINDETKEIADITSRNSIENMAAVVAAHDDDIQYIQFETGPEGTFLTAVADTQTLARAAQTSAEAASDAATLANEKAESAEQAADRAWDYADSASEAASHAWDKASEAADAAEVANQKAIAATDSANVAWTQAESAIEAADVAWNKADEASTAADLANRKADEASVAAEAAQKDARDANKYANGALAGLSTLESVIDTVNWFAEHKSLSTDTQVNNDKDYYIYDSSTGTMSKVEPTGSENPSEEGWYEIDETIQNYVVSHVAQTDDGLYVLSTGEGWRILISTGAGNYVPGVFIVDPTGVIKQALTGSGIRFDNTVPYSIGDDQAYIVFDGNGHITLGGDGVNILSGVTIGGSQKTLSQVLNDLDSAIISIEYGVGSSRTSHSDITNWSSASPQWESGKYVWMRTSNGTTYTYTCIQGAQGERGEQGPQGEPGAAGTTGIGVASVEISYAISNSGETIPDTWTSSINQWYPVEESEEIEPSEEPIETEPSEEPIETESSEEPTQEEVILNIEPGTWLWVKTETIYTDNTSSVTYQKSYIGTDGQDGTSVFIQSSSKENGVTTLVLADSEGNTETITINDGEDGTNGTPGQSGYVHIAWATSQDGSEGFSTSVSTDKTYIGVYTDTTEADSETPSDYSWSLIKGADGTSITIDNIKYATSLNESPQPSDASFNLTMPSITQGMWLWVKTTYSDNSVAVTKSYIGKDGEDGTSVFIESSTKENGITTVVLVDNDGNETNLTIADGQDGTDGTPGTNGKNIHIAWADTITIDQNGIVTATGFSTSESANKKYMGVYDSVESADSNDPSDYNWSLIKGDKGDPGDSAYVYELLCDPSAIVKTTPTDIPPRVTFTAKRTQGAGALADYSARFIISTSEDGTNWTHRYTSASNEATKQYIAPAEAKFIKCELYLAGSTTTLLDTQTIPIISDGHQGEDGKILNIHSGIYTELELPDIGTVNEADAYLVDDGDNQYDLYYKGTDATTWTIVENWQGVAGPQGEPGAPGSPGANGADGYTIILTNESHNFPAGTSAAISSSTTCNIIAYKGITQIPASIGTITGQVTGLTTSITNNNSTSAGFTVNVENTLTTRNGTLIIPIVIDGKSFEKKFSWTLSIQGQKGDKGDPGQNGAAGPEAIVTITPTTIDWNAGTATLSAVLRVNGVITTPTGYNWTKGTETTSLGTAATLNVTDLNSTYNCTVTW